MLALPLNANKKVDRKSFPKPEAVRPALDSVFISSRTPIEEQLVKLWSDLLQIDEVGIHDNFFELGGDSLRGAQMVTRLRKMFGVELPLKTLLDKETVARLAEEIVQLQHESTARLMPPLVPAKRSDVMPLSSAQQQLWLADQLQPGGFLYNVPLVLHLEGVLHQKALKQSLDALLERHETLRTTFPLREDQVVQVIAPASPLLVHFCDLSSLSSKDRDRQVAQLIEAETQKPFDLASGPENRAVLLCLSDLEHILLLNMHHIATDGWSIWLLLKELTTFYDAYNRDTLQSLPILPIQYRDYAIWQRQWLQAPFEETLLRYWRKQLANMPAFQLATDYPRPPKLTFQGATYAFSLPATLHHHLTALSHSEGATLFMTLLAAWQILLSCYTGQMDIVVGTDIAGRPHQELENLIGFFVNQLVLRVDLSGNPSFREIIQRVRKVTLDAFAHQYLPFERLVSDLKPTRKLNMTPFFQIKFVMQAFPLETIDLPQLRVRPMENLSHTAQFDLLLSLLETSHGIDGIFQYRTELFTTHTIRRMTNDLRVLLEKIVAEPALHLDEYTLPNQNHT